MPLPHISSSASSIPTSAPDSSAVPSLFAATTDSPGLEHQQPNATPEGLLNLSRNPLRTASIRVSSSPRTSVGRCVRSSWTAPGDYGMGWADEPKMNQGVASIAARQPAAFSNDLQFVRFIHDLHDAVLGAVVEAAQVEIGTVPDDVGILAVRCGRGVVPIVDEEHPSVGGEAGVHRAARRCRSGSWVRVTARTRRTRCRSSAPVANRTRRRRRSRHRSARARSRLISSASGDASTTVRVVAVRASRCVHQPVPPATSSTSPLGPNDLRAASTIATWRCHSCVSLGPRSYRPRRCHHSSYTGARAR